MEPILPLPQLEPTTLHTIVIRLGAAEEGTVPACGRAIHAQVLDWIRLSDPAMSEAIHQAQVSPLSLSGLIGGRRRGRVKAGDELYFRIGLLDGSLITPLLDGLEQWGDQPFSLAKFPFVFRSVDMLPGSDPWVGSSDYALLAKTPIAANDITLKFLSPTSFKLKSGQGIQPFPLPENVFGSLERRWNVFAPEALRLPKILWGGLVAQYELKTQSLRMEKSVEIGAVGEVRYRFNDPEQTRFATMLSQFAFFAGVGRKTTMGMGQVILDPKK